MRILVHPLPKYLSSDVCVLIDALRATCTISAALANGASGVRPVKSIKEALNFRGEALLAGERNGVKIEGFDLGNSPNEMMNLQGKEIVLTTTNGTRAISMLKCNTVIAASFPNISAIKGFISSFDRADLICSGDNGEISLEDFLLAGMIAELDENPTDAARISQMYAKSVHNIKEEVLRSSHARHLIEIGFSKDIDFCMSIDTLDVVPILKDGVFRRLIL